MLAVAVTLKLISEIALLALLGQRVLGSLVSGPGRDGNFFYQVLSIVGKPFVAMARLLCPASVPERKLAWLAMAVLALAWLAATAAKIHLCLQTGVNLCK